MRHAPGFQPFQGSDLFERIGGQAAVDRLVDALYDRFETDELIRPLFRSDLGKERNNQKRSVAEWLGGPPRYSETSWAGLHHRHDDLPITRALAGRWLGHFRRSVEQVIGAEAEREGIFEAVSSLAFSLVNTEESEARPSSGKRTPASRHRSEVVARCGVAARVVGRAREHARRGELGALKRLLGDVPEILLRFGPELMQCAALAGRGEVIELLLERGVADRLDDSSGIPW